MLFRKIVWNFWNGHNIWEFKGGKDTGIGKFMICALTKAEELFILCLLCRTPRDACDAAAPLQGAPDDT